MPHYNSLLDASDQQEIYGLFFLKKVAARLKPEIALVIIGIVFGVLMLFTIAPFQIPDEYQHFSNAYLISELKLFKTNGYLPRGYGKLMQLTAGMPFDPMRKIPIDELLLRWDDPLLLDERFPVELPAASVYTPIPYIFSAFGLAMGRWTGISPLMTFYLGRFLNFAVWIALAYLSLRLAPVFKWTFLLLMLTPMALSQAGSYSADSLTNAISFLWLAICLNLAFTNRDQPLKSMNYLVMVLFAVLFPLLKAPYSVLIGLVILIPASRYRSRKHAILTYIVLALITGCLVIITSSINRGYYFSKVPFPGVDGHAQLVYMLRNPIAFFHAVVNTVQQKYIIMGTAYIGILGWLDTRLPDFVYLSYFLMIPIIALVDSTSAIKITLQNKLILASISVLSFFGVAAGQYVTWTPVAAKIVSDIQGRYLIPIVPPAVLLIYNQRFNKHNWIAPYLVIGYVSVILGIAVFFVTRRFWVF